MIKFSALNEGFDSDSENEEPEDLVTKEVQEEAAHEVYNKALELQTQGCFSEAEATFKELLQSQLLSQVVPKQDEETPLTPGLTLKYLAYKNLGSIAAEKGNFYDAVDSYLEAVSIDATDVTLWYRIGHGALKLHKYALARLAFEEGLKCSSGHWPCLDNLITVLYALNEYASCLYYISVSLEKECYYLKGLVFRNKILQEDPSLNEYCGSFFKNCSPSIYTAAYDDEEGKKLIDEALAFRAKKQEISRPPPLPLVNFLQPLTDFSWKSLGESLLAMYDHIASSDPPISYGCRVDLTNYTQIPQTSPSSIEVSETLVSSSVLSSSVTTVTLPQQNQQHLVLTSISKENLLYSTPLDTKLLIVDPQVPQEYDSPALLTESGHLLMPDVGYHSLLQTSQVQDLDASCYYSVTTTSSRRGAKRKRLSSESYEVGSKRRSARVRNTTKKPQDHVNYQELIQKFLPAQLMGDKREEFREEEEGIIYTEDGRGGDHTYGQCENTDSREEKKTLKPTNSLCFEEKEDVRNFFVKHQNNGGILDLLYCYLKHLSEKSNVKWPSGLTDVYMAIYVRNRKHFTLPSLFCQDIDSEVFRNRGMTVLVNCELKVDKWHTSTGRSNGTCISPAVSPRGRTTGSQLGPDFPGKHFISDLEFLVHLIVRQEVWGDNWKEFALRVLWLKSKYHTLNGEADMAASCLERILTLLTKENKSESFQKVDLVNCFSGNIITIEFVQELLESLQRYQSLEEVQKLFEQGDYEAVVSLLIPTFKQPSTKSKVSGESNIPERHAQLLLLQDSLWKLESYQVCLKWGEVAFNEALHQYMNASTTSDRSDWANTMTNLLQGLERCISKDKKLVDQMEDVKLVRFTQNLMQVICLQMDSSDYYTETSIQTILPWVLLYRMIVNEKCKTQDKVDKKCNINQPEVVSQEDETNKKKIDNQEGDLVVNNQHVIVRQKSVIESHVQHMDVDQNPETGSANLSLIEGQNLDMHSKEQSLDSIIKLEPFSKSVASERKEEIQCFEQHVIDSLKNSQNSTSKSETDNILSNDPFPDESQKNDTISSTQILIDNQNYDSKSTEVLAFCHNNIVESTQEQVIEQQKENITLHTQRDIKSGSNQVVEDNQKENSEANIVDKNQISNVFPKESEIPHGISSSLMFLLTAHECLGNRSLCCASDGALLLLCVDVALEELKKSPSPHPHKEELEMAVEQCFYCLYAHPSKRTKAKHLQEHNAPQIILTWERAVQLFDYFKPSVLPEFDSYKSSTISAECEILLRRISALVPPQEDPSNNVDKVVAYIEGGTDRYPSFHTDKPLGVVKDIYYLLGDYYFKNKEFGKAIRFYILDICVNSDRIDSWAGMALARSSQLEQKLNSCELKSEATFYRKASSALRCFKRAVELDTTNTAIWVEYGSLAYMLHSHASRQLKQQHFPFSDDIVELLQTKQKEMLDTAFKCFKAASKCGDERGWVDEAWLHHYMLGKISEKRREHPKLALEHYKMAASYLHRDGACYPKKIHYHSPKELSIESLEVYYRTHGVVLKYLLQNEGKLISSDDLAILQNHIKFSEESPFANYQEKRDINRENQYFSPSSSEAEDYTVPSMMKKKVKKAAAMDHDYIQQQSKVDTTTQRAYFNSLDSSSESQDSAAVKDILNSLIAVVCERCPSQATEGTRVVGDQRVKKTFSISEAEKPQTLVEEKHHIEDREMETFVNEKLSCTEKDVKIKGITELAPSHEENIQSHIENQTKSRESMEDILHDLTAKCVNSLGDCLQRFSQHYKSLYRLAHFYYTSSKYKNIQWSQDVLLGTSTPWQTLPHMPSPGLFAERKNTNFFNGIWRIPSDEIDRPGSFASHMYRSVSLLLEILKEQTDSAKLLHVALQLSRTPDMGKKYLRDIDRIYLSRKAADYHLNVHRDELNNLLQESPPPEEWRLTNCLLDIFRSWQTCQKAGMLTEEADELLEEAYTMYNLGEVDTSPPVLQQAIQFCQTQMYKQTQCSQDGHRSNSTSKFQQSTEWTQESISTAINFSGEASYASKACSSGPSSSSTVALCGQFFPYWMELPSTISADIWCQIQQTDLASQLAFSAIEERILSQEEHIIIPTTLMSGNNEHPLSVMLASKSCRDERKNSS
ncbi:calcineurin-binding protein cabin-1-like isoform X4 [Tachypleus tridentatus]|uniref:calcineurin-binding protein cabin-1-like isoform X4 n=1 Tax=Tachypleus tridentatus TaxID=6853 RepID=UPI003FD35621